MIIGVALGVGGGMAAAHGGSRGASEATVIVGCSLFIIGLFMAVIGVVDYARAPLVVDARSGAAASPRSPAPKPARPSRPRVDPSA